MKEVSSGKRKSDALVLLLIDASGAVTLDGFRALALVSRNRCSLVSRNDRVFKSWPER